MWKDHTIINNGCNFHDASLFSNVWTDVEKFHSGFQDGCSVRLDLAARSTIFKCIKLFLCGELRESCMWLTPTALPRGKNTQINATKMLLRVFMWVELMKAFDDLMISPFQAKMSDHEGRTSSQWNRFLFYKFSGTVTSQRRDQAVDLLCSP